MPGSQTSSTHLSPSQKREMAQSTSLSQAMLSQTFPPPLACTHSSSSLQSRSSHSLSMHTASPSSSSQRCPAPQTSGTSQGPMGGAPPSPPDEVEDVLITMPVVLEVFAGAPA